MANNNVTPPLPTTHSLLYDPEDSLWTVIDSPQSPLLYYSLLKLRDSRVLAVGIGANEEGEFTGAASLFDPETDSWQELPSKPTLNAKPRLAQLQDGRVLVAGGKDLQDLPGLEALSEMGAVQILNLELLQWEATSPLPEGFIVTDEDPPLTTLPDERVLALGFQENGRDHDAAAVVYDPAAGNWRPLQGIDPYYRMLDALLIPDGRVLVFGTVSDKSLDSWSCYEPDCHDYGSIRLTDGRRIDHTNLAEEFPRAKFFDPRSDTWSDTGALRLPRLHGTYTVLPDGRVLAAGGTVMPLAQNPWNQVPEYISITGIFDPMTRRWQEGPELDTTRKNHTATILPTGDILLAGGIRVYGEKARCIRSCQRRY